LREEYKLQVSENCMFREVLGPKKDEISEQIRIFYNEEQVVWYC
jgi:hypothetical protein